MNLNEASKNNQELFQKKGINGTYWKLCAFTLPLFELGYFIIFATVICSSLLFNLPSPNMPKVVPIILIALWVGVIDYLTSTSKAAAYLGKAYFLLLEIFYLIVFLAFYYVVDGIMFDFLYFIIAGCFAFVIYADTKRNVVPKLTESGKKIVMTYMAIFFFVASSGYFGRDFYGYIRSSLGGGEPEQVQVVVDELNTPSAIKKALNITNSLSSKVNLIAQTDSDIFLGYPKSNLTQEYKTVIRVDRKLIKAVISNDMSVIKYIKMK